MAAPNGQTVPRSYIAGHFRAAWSPTAYGSAGAGTPSWVTIGSTEKGWELKPSILVDPVNDDAFGRGAADTIMQGVDMTLDGLTVEAGKVNASGVMFAVPGAEGHSNNNVGLRGSDLYGSLCLTPIAGTPAAATPPQGIGAGNSYVIFLCAVIGDPSQLLASTLRKIPLNFMCLPDPANSNEFYQIVTTPAGVPST